MTQTTPYAPQGRDRSTSGAPACLIRLADARAAYGAGRVEALAGVSLTVSAGERLCIMGANGSGKSTLLGLMNGLVLPSDGEVELFGLDPRDRSCGLAIRRWVATVFQNPDDQAVASVVADDVAFGLENLGVPRREMIERVEGALDAVGLSGCAHRDLADLSGGQRQLVALAGAIAMEPDVLLLDEPSSMLDGEARSELASTLDRLGAAGMAIVHVSHFVEDAVRADRVIVLDRGRIALEGAPEEVFSHAAELRRLGLEAPFAIKLANELARRREAFSRLPVTVREDVLANALAPMLRAGERDASDTPSSALTGEGSARGESGAAAPEAPGRPAISFDDVSFSYDAAANPRKRRRRALFSGPGPQRGTLSLALDGAAFEVPEGAVTVIAGRNGSGKTTALELACALKLPLSGTVRTAQIDTSDLSARRELRRRVGFASQFPERQLFAETVFDDVAFGPRNLGLDEDEVASRVEGALGILGLGASPELFERSPFSLSGGQQRLVALAGVISMRPAVLVLDEPLAGLDAAGRRRMADLVAQLKCEGATVVAVSHSMDDTAEIADHVVALAHGRVIAQGPVREVLRDERVRAEVGCTLPARFARLLADRGAALGSVPLTLDDLAEEVCHGAAR